MYYEDVQSCEKRGTTYKFSAHELTVALVAVTAEKVAFPASGVRNLTVLLSLLTCILCRVFSVVSVNDISCGVSSDYLPIFTVSED